MKTLTIQMTLTEANALMEAAWRGGIVIKTCRKCSGDAARTTKSGKTRVDHPSSHDRRRR